MKIRDRHLKKHVDVSRPQCPTFQCYWPRPDPGIFTPGQGYHKASTDRGYLCGTREIHGCPKCPRVRDDRPD